MVCDRSTPVFSLLFFTAFAHSTGLEGTKDGKCQIHHGYDCVGNDMTSKSTRSVQDCCDLCHNTPECSAFTYAQYDAHGKLDPTCYLKFKCPTTTANPTCVAGQIASPSPAPAPTPTPPSPTPNSTIFDVGRGDFDVSGYQCGDKSSKTLIFYPKPKNGMLATPVQGADTFHVVVYAHGIGGGIDGCDSWLTTVASRGLIVVAPFTSGGACETEYQDILLALSAAKKGGAGLHPALKMADWSRTGVFGHSMGGMSVPGAAVAAAKYNITCMLSSHGAIRGVHPWGGGEWGTDHITIPSMFTTGSADTTVAAADVRAAFDACPARPKIFAELVGAGHMEPRDGGKRLNNFDADFLACHVSNHTESCKLIYGQGPRSLCKANAYTSCVIEDAF